MEVGRSHSGPLAAAPRTVTGGLPPRPAGTIPGRVHAPGSRPRVHTQAAPSDERRADTSAATQLGRAGRHLPDVRAIIAARLACAGVSHKALYGAAAAAAANGTCFTDELIAEGDASEADVGRAVADELRLGFVERVDPDAVLSSKDDGPEPFRSARRVIVGDDANTLHCIAPRLDEIADLRADIARRPVEAARLRICTPGSLAAAFRVRHESEIVRRAVESVEAVSPWFSAREVATA